MLNFAPVFTPLDEEKGVRINQHQFVCVCVRAGGRASMRAGVRAYMRARVRVRVRVCMYGCVCVCLLITQLYSLRTDGTKQQKDVEAMC